MTDEEKKQWIEDNFIQPDLDTLKECGFTVEVEKNENLLRPERKYCVVISHGDFEERIYNCRHLEIIADTLKEYNVILQSRTALIVEKCSL